MKKKSDNNTFIVVGSKTWNKEVFNAIISRYPGEWHFIADPKDLTMERISKIHPRSLFFLHWSLKIPQEIIDAYECVNFHETDVPYGRGGSPVQNLITRGHKETKLSALRMTNEFDAGPVYLKKSLSLFGGAEEIFIRASELAAKMILEIITKNLKPKKQEGKVVVFKRRIPEQSEIPDGLNLADAFDFIRMLDAKDYPKAFIRYKGLRLEFSRAALYDKKIACDVSVTKDETA